MTIKPAFPNEFNIIQSIAARTWPEAYAEILSAGQLRYMLDRMYSLEALNRDYDDGVKFLLAESGADYFGFSGFEHGYRGENKTHIHKIYVLPDAQGKNVGRKLMHEMQAQALANGSDAITLNVNRRNGARYFYEKLGFEIIKSVDIEIGNGYLMEDFIMQKTL